MHALQGRVVQSWVKITRVSAKFELRFESLKSISALILFVYKLMIGSSKNSTENYARKCFWIQEKETRVNFNPRLSANRPSNNSAQVCRKNCEVLSLVMLTSILTQILEGGGGLILGWIPLCTENKINVVCKNSRFSSLPSTGDVFTRMNVCYSQTEIAYWWCKSMFTL